ncbi:reverse transcriptase domain-containing protein [Tanacetum coccineum]|uniref:Reverse transcriptase domain-containing protein n=1 Tax=Tanacetum coccineum TaxID=301880 RepID=A0ABQ4ZFQ3_9ASTR
MTPPRPFVTPRAGVLIPFIILFDPDDETAESLHTQTASTLVVHPPPTRPLSTSSAIVLRPGQEIPFPSSFSPPHYFCHHHLVRDLDRLHHHHQSPPPLSVLPPPSIVPPPSSTLLPPPPEHVESVADDIETMHARLIYAEQETLRAVYAEQEVRELQDFRTGDGVRTQRAMMTKQVVEALCARAEAIEQRAEALHISLGAAQIDITNLMESRRADRLEMTELRSRAQNIEASIWEIKRHLGLSFTEIEQVERQEDKVTENASNQKKWEGDHGGSSSQKQNKGHKVIGEHTAGPSSKRVYAGNLPHYNRCKLHHTRPCIIQCNSCKKVGHLTRDCWTSISVTTQKPQLTKQKMKATCYEYGILGHYKSVCPKWKSQNQVNKHGRGKAREDSSVMAYYINA